MPVTLSSVKSLSGAKTPVCQFRQLRCQQANEQQGACQGLLAMKHSWPSTLRTIYGDHDRYEVTYFSGFKVSSQCRPLQHVPADQDHASLKKDSW